MSRTDGSTATVPGSFSGSGAGAVECEVSVDVAVADGQLVVTQAAALPGRGDPELRVTLERPEAVRVRRELGRSLAAAAQHNHVPLGGMAGAYSTGGPGMIDTIVELSLHKHATGVTLHAECDRPATTPLSLESRLETGAGAALHDRLGGLIETL